MYGVLPYLWPQYPPHRHGTNFNTQKSVLGCTEVLNQFPSALMQPVEAFQNVFINAFWDILGPREVIAGVGTTQKWLQRMPEIILQAGAV